MTLRSTVAVAGLSLFIAACGGETPGAPTPATVSTLRVVASPVGGVVANEGADGGTYPFQREVDVVLEEIGGVDYRVTSFTVQVLVPGAELQLDAVPRMSGDVLAARGSLRLGSRIVFTEAARGSVCRVVYSFTLVDAAGRPHPYGVPVTLTL